MDVERASVWFYSDDRTAIECVMLYEMTPDRFSSGVVLSERDYPGYFNALRERGVIVADNAHTHPDTCEFSEGYLTPLGIQSMLDVPIRLGEQTIGVLCHEHIGSRRHWTLEEEAFAGSMAVMVSLALEAARRNESQRALRKRAAEMQAVAEVGAEAAASLNPYELLWNVVNVTKERFDLYHTHIYLLDDTGDNLILAAGAGDIGRAMVQAGHPLVPARTTWSRAPPARAKA
jgi:transcriptional regulator with GAF, ATPase, and Fis domain